VFSRAGWDVAIQDSVREQCERAIGAIEASLSELAELGLVEDPRGAAKRVRIADSLADAVKDADFVQENSPEKVDQKQAVFRELDRYALPHVPLASSTSSIVASHFTEHLPGRARCLVGHPINPPHLVPLVELAGAPWTSPETIARAQDVYTAIGQVPIVVRKETDGFIVNRLQGVLLAEAFRLVGEGYVSPQDLDKSLKDGLGLRWSFMGPFETIELNAPGGIADYCARFGESYQRRQVDPAKPEVFETDNVERILREWGEAPTPERLDARTRWRDRRLAALRVHMRSQPES